VLGAEYTSNLLLEKLDFHQHTAANCIKPLVLKLVSTPARGNENSWEAVEYRTARQIKTDEEAGWILQG